MSGKKWAGAIAAAFAVLVATNWFIHGILLRSQYEAMALSFRPFEVIRARMWMVLAGEAAFSAAFVFIYVRGLERRGWLGQGIRYGILIWLLTVVPATLAEFVTMYIPHRLALEWMGAGLAQLAIAGAVVAAIAGTPQRARTQGQ